MSPTLHVTAGNQICHDDLKLKKHDQTLCCGACINCVDNKSPNAYMVKIRGVKNHDPPECESCADVGATSFNGDFVLPVTTAPSKCLFAYSTNTPCYPFGNRLITLNIVPFFGDNQITAYVSIGSEVIVFVNSYGMLQKPNCIVTDMEVDHNRTNMTTCHGEDATCHITAL